MNINSLNNRDSSNNFLSTKILYKSMTALVAFIAACCIIVLSLYYPCFRCRPFQILLIFFIVYMTSFVSVYFEMRKECDEKLSIESVSKISYQAIIPTLVFMSCYIIIPFALSYFLFYNVVNNSNILSLLVPILCSGFFSTITNFIVDKYLKKDMCESS